MDTFLLYLLKTSVCLTLFYVCFKALFSNDTFFRFNRRMLLVGTGICLIIPLVPLHEDKLSAIGEPVRQLEQVLLDRPQSPTDTAQPALSPVQPELRRFPYPSTLPWATLLGAIYGLGAAFCLFTTFLSFRKMFELIRRGRKVTEAGYRLVILPEPVPPFSWGRHIILSEEDYRNHPEEILTHEKMHLQCRHSMDLLYMELILLLQWFNPAAWLLKKELRDLHEYQADKAVLEKGVNATKYQLLLVKKAVGSSRYTLANSFNHSKIKKRITMMLKKKSNKWARLKLLLLVPVGFTALSVFARPVSPPQPNQPENRMTAPSVSANKDTRKAVPNQEMFSATTKKAVQAPDSQPTAVPNPQEGKQAKQKIAPPPPPPPPPVVQDGTKKKEGKKVEKNIPPPPPPPPPAGSVQFHYKGDKPAKQFTLFARYAQNNKNVGYEINHIYSDDIVKVTILLNQRAPEGLLESVQKVLKEKIKYPVEYETVQEK